jgi:PrsW family intramembrane metalloprotease
VKRRARGDASAAWSALAIFSAITSPASPPACESGAERCGYAASENLLYLSMAALQGGYAGLLRGAYLRATVYGMNHAVFTATTGAAMGCARTTTSRPRAAIVLLVGVAAAVALHVFWNTVVSDAISRMLCAAPAADAACRNPPPPWMLYVTVPVMVTLFIGPCVAALIAIAARARAGCPAKV